MSWLRIDDSFYDHPKIIAAGPLCMALHVCALGYSARHLTDGVIPHGVVPFLARFDGIALFHGERQRGPRLPIDVYALADRLVEVGLWETREEDFLIHDYLDYNPSKTEVEKGKQAHSERQKRYRSKQSANRDADSDASRVTPRTPTRTPRSIDRPSVGSREGGMRSLGEVLREAQSAAG